MLTVLCLHSGAHAWGGALDVFSCSTSSLTEQTVFVCILIMGVEGFAPDFSDLGGLGRYLLRLLGKEQRLS